MSEYHSLKEAGFIIGEATPTEFLFISDKDRYPQKWEYLLVPSWEYVDGSLRKVEVLAQVERVVSMSEVMTQRLDIESLERIKESGIDEVKTLIKARILGYAIDDKNGFRIQLPRRAVVPGNPVYVAPKDFLSKFFSYPEGECLHIGSLISRPDVPAHLSVSGFRRHLAIIAQTGAGKSYCAGVLIEELLKLGSTVVVIDPHADYVFLSLTPEGDTHELSDRITVFRNPASTGRYGKENIKNLKKYEVAFPTLSEDDVCEVAGIRRDWAKIREAVRQGLERLKESGSHYTPEDLMSILEEMSRSEDDRGLREGALSSIKYVRALVKLRVFSAQSTPINAILKPMHASIIDLSGLDDVSMDYIASRILNETFDTVVMGAFPYPVFVIVEEAHRFIPSGNHRTFSSSILRRIAAEGRKFGLFLILITQRPSRIHPDSLSQCNSQIIMRLTNPHDQNAVAQSSERMSQDLLDDLPGLNPGEAIIVGEVTRLPIMVRVRRRLTKEGGADIDIAAMLKRARDEVYADEVRRKSRERQLPFRGVFSEV